MSYSPPSSAKPFTLNIPDKDLSEWRQLLQLSKIGPTTYENTQTEHHYGVTKKWLSETKEYWLNKYDWRAQEKHINSFDNFRMLIDGIDVHFIGHFSDKKDAVPIVFMHGWPGSFIEFIPMLELIRDKWSKKDLPYHIIVPSLPGYTLSAETQPTDKDWTMEDTADIIDKLMTNLGFAKYLAQGGDVGSFVARLLGQSEKNACVGIHVNMFTTGDQPDPSTLSPTQQAALARAGTWLESGRAYALEHGTRPSTIGHVLSSNPLALLAWIGEKFLEWSDEPPSLDHILTNISLYWFTSGFPRSIYPYRVLFGPSRPNLQHVHKPTGASYFHHEIVPVFKSVVEKNANLVAYAEHERGGHFAALERPVEFWADVREYVDKAWKETPNGAKL